MSPGQVKAGHSVKREGVQRTEKELWASQARNSNLLFTSHGVISSVLLFSEL